MNHIVFDLELNTAFKAGLKPGSMINKVCPNEIIEIGAVKIDDNFNIVDSFQALVKPTLYKILSPIVRKKTGITYKNIYNGKRFTAVFRSFMEWLGDSDCTFYSWGYGDILDLRRNCRLHKIKTGDICGFIDLQEDFSQKFNLEKGVNYSLKKALEYLDIETEGDFHRALNDAEYTARIFIKLYSGR